MKQNLESALYQAAALTFEELGFLCPLPAGLSESPSEPLAVKAQVAFRGPFSGRLEIRTSPALLEILAANMLGEAAPPALVQQYDAWAETANVICGNMLPRIAGPQAIFDLAAPQVSASSGAPVDPEAPTVSAQIDLDEGRAELLLFLSGVPA